MSIEHPVETSAISRATFEALYLPERRVFTKSFDAAIHEWVDRPAVKYPLIANTAITTLVTDDCRIEPNMRVAIYNRGLIGASEGRRDWFKRRIRRLRFLSEFANDTTLDAAPITSETYAVIFADLIDYASTGDESSKFSEALTYVRRLFISREQLAQAEGRDTINVTDFREVLRQLLAEEEKLRTNPIY